MNGKPVERKAAINRVSPKRKEEEKEYLKIREKKLKANPICEFPGCNKKAVDAHHSAGRVGKNYLNIKKLKAVCRAHHNWIHLNHLLSIEMGMSEPRLMKS